MKCGICFDRDALCSWCQRERVAAFERWLLVGLVVIVLIGFKAALS